MSDIQGTFTALITPFAEDDEIDWASLEQIIQIQLQAEVDGLVLLGTTGEALALSGDESAKVVQFARARVGGKLPLWLGSGASSTRATLLQSERAEKLGADGLMIVTPPYVKPNQSGIRDHFAAICKHVDLPIMIYNNPARSACGLSVNTLLELCQHSNVVAIKESGGDMSQWVDLIEQRPARVSVLAGDDSAIYPMLALGAQGAISVLANARPKSVKQLIDYLLAGALIKARSHYFKLWPLIRALSLETNPLIVKYLMQAGGLCSARTRTPLGEICDTTKLQLQSLTRELLKKGQ